MSTLNLDGISLMAFSSTDVIEAWKEEVREAERQKTQLVDKTTYTRVAHTDRYSRVAHTDTYSKVAHTDRYSRTAARNTYSKVAAVDVYSKTANRDTYTRVVHTNTYTRVAHTNSYSEVAKRDTYKRVAHTDRYSRTAHRDSYSRRASRTTYHNYYSRSYSRASHTNRYSKRHTAYKKTQIGHSNSYNKRSDRRVNGTGYSVYTAYRDYTRGSYSQRAARNYTRGSYTAYYYRIAHTDRYTRAAHRNSYSKVAYTDRYTRVAHTDRYTKTVARDTYSEVAKRDTYSRVAHSDVYSRTAAQDTYTRVAHTDVYTRAATADRYTRAAEQNKYTKNAAYSKGFDHTNYIPTPPELYNVDGQVITGTLEIRMSSYDANNDGHGSQDQKSKDIYYIVKIRQIQDLAGNKVNKDWTVIQKGAMVEDLDFSLDGYPNGIYEVSTQAYNPSRTENGVTKTYISDEKISVFTICEGGIGSDITILNAPEFMDYIYGLETYVTRQDEIKRYVDSIIYAKSDNQKGLFLEIRLEDEDINTYHKVKVSLVKDNTIIAENYDVVFPTDSNNKPLPGDKTGVVFIHLDDMMDNGSFTDVQVMLDVTEYKDSAFKNVIGETVRHIGVSEASDIVYIDIDNKKPTINITEPIEGGATIQNVNVTYADVGLGIRESYYQVVESGDKPDADGWIEVNGKSTQIKLNKNGVYDIYAKTVDKAGNETTSNKKGYKITDKVIKLEVPDTMYQGTKFDAHGTVENEKDIERTEFWVQNYGDIVDGEQKDEQENPDGTVRTEHIGKLTLPNDIPLGTHIAYFKVYYKDGTTETVSEPFKVISLDEGSATDGPRYIIKDFIGTISPDSIWNTDAEYKKALEDSLNNETPLETHTLKKEKK